MQTHVIIAVILLALLAALSLGFANGNAVMMEKCQQAHSFERCHELINN